MTRITGKSCSQSCSESSGRRSALGDEGGDDEFGKETDEAGEDGGVYNFSQRIGNMEEEKMSGNLGSLNGAIT